MKYSFWDLFTIVVLVGTAVVIIVVLAIFMNPDSAINPFPRPTLPPTIMVPSPTATLFSMPPTWTPIPQVEATRRPTSTLFPTSTPFVVP